MSLQKQQDFLARLFTDEDLRQNFLSVPEKIGAENGLSQKEITDLKTVLPEQLNFFADSLFWKRLRETEKILPLTKEISGEKFTGFFREFSQKFNPRSVKKHFEDAVEFCRYLQKKDVPLEVKDAARFERARLIFNSYAKNIVFEKFDFDIREFLQNFSGEQSFAEIDFKKRKTFAFWIRIGKIKKHFMW